MPAPIRAALLAFAALSLFGAAPTFAQDAVDPFTKLFVPDTIGPGSVSQLQFTITNTSGTPLTDVAFTDNLPAGVTVATPANASLANCGPSPTLTATAGTGTITLANGGVGTSQPCTIFVDVTASTAGAYVNTTGTLTHSTGDLGTASDTLTVTDTLPGFSKAFSPTSVPLGSPSTLTFTIDNTANGAAATSLAFTDTLPAGLQIASPSGASTTCGAAILSAPAGGSTISIAGGSVGAMSSCTVSVGIATLSAGTFVNVSGDLTSGGGATSSGKATAALEVTSPAGAPLLQKSFTDDPANPGGTVTLQFTITNTDRFSTATSIAFTDNLGTTLTGLAPAAGQVPAAVCNGGTLSFAGTTLSLTGGSLPAQGSCTFSLTLDIPAGAASGSYPNVTSNVTAVIGGMTVTGNTATDNLFIEADAPLITKTFTTNPVILGVTPGNTVTMDFVITAQGSPLTDIAFTDQLAPPFSSAITYSGLPFGACGGTVATTSFGAGTTGIALTGGSLAAGASCTFSVSFSLPSDTPAGDYTNTTNPITATSGRTTVTGGTATDTLTVEVPVPLQLSKSFTDDPIPAGGTGTLQFTIQNTSDSINVTDIGFTDDLAAVLPGTPDITVTGLPIAACGGTLSSSAGDTFLTLSGGSLAANTSCTFSVSFVVPAGTAANTYTNTTSDISGTGGGVMQTVAMSAATDDLVVVEFAGPTLTKQFIGDPVVAGDTVPLRFTISNPNPSGTFSNISFTDDLNAALAGLASTSGTVNGICGGGSSISGTTALTFTGGNLAAGTSCTFDLTLAVPAGAAAGDFLNTTSNVSADVGMTGVTGAPASDTLTVSGAALQLAKSFTNDPVAPGGSVNLEFTITNTSAANAATAISFTDDLDAALTGLASTSGTVTGICGGGSISGTSSLSFSGGSLAAGASCTFSVTVLVPGGAAPGAYTNTTSQVAGTVSMTAVTGNAASDDLNVTSGTATLAKTFVPDTASPGDTVALQFTITNTSAGGQSLSDLRFTDPLPAGLTATGLPASNVCGAGSQLSGSSTLSLQGGTLAGGASCMFSVTLSVPGGAALGTYTNTTSQLLEVSTPVGAAAQDDLFIVGPPGFGKAFAPNPVAIGVPSTLTFTIDNTGNTAPATSLAFSDTFPAGLVVAATPNVNDGCGGALTAAAGAVSISYSGGSVPAGAMCTVSVDVSANTAGDYANTSSDLTSSLGTTPAATDTLRVTANALVFSKVFAPNPVVVGVPSTLTFTIDNTGNAAAATALTFTDNFPTGLVVAPTPNVSDGCGGTLTVGTDSVSYAGGTVPASATCTVSIDVAAGAPGDYANTSSDLTSSLGTTPAASATLTVTANALVFSKVFAPNPVAVGVPSTLTFTIDNSGNTAPATSLAFSDTFPAGLVVAPTPNVSDGCGGTLTVGTDSVSYAGGTVPASATCTVSIDVAAGAPGDYANTSSDLTSSLGTTPAASATLTVTATPLVFSKAFAPDSIIVGAVTTLTFTIDNTANGAAATALAFTDNLPAELDVAATPNASTTCGGGTITAVSGTSTVSYSGGTVPAGAVCTVQVDITGTAIGTFTNTTGSLTSSFGDSGTASATLTVTQDPAVIIAQTQEVIRNFLNRRADLITIEDPNLTPHLDGPGSGPPANVSAYYETGSTDFAFSTSLARLAYAAGAGARAEESLALASLGYADAAGQHAPRFDIWAQGTFTSYNDSSVGASNEGLFGLLYLGAEYRARPNLLLGLMAQLDWTDENDSGTNIGAGGTGWMAGPYAVGRLGQHVYVQARGAWGMSDNDVTPFGTYTDSFDTTRWLASGKVEGRFLAGSWRFSPTLGVIYFQENQQSYVDTNGLTIPSQTVALGRATFGPEMAYRHSMADGGYIEPSLGVIGVFDFDEDGKVLGGVATAADSVRARVSGGLTFQGANGARLGAQGFYDGLGDDNFEAYGGKVKLVLPLQ